MTLCCLKSKKERLFCLSSSEPPLKKFLNPRKVLLVFHRLFFPTAACSSQAFHTAFQFCFEQPTAAVGTSASASGGFDGGRACTSTQLRAVGQGRGVVGAAYNNVGCASLQACFVAQEQPHTASTARPAINKKPLH